MKKKSFLMLFVTPFLLGITLNSCSKTPTTDSEAPKITYNLNSTNYVNGDTVKIELNLTDNLTDKEKLLVVIEITDPNGGIVKYDGEYSFVASIVGKYSIYIKVSDEAGNSSESKFNIDVKNKEGEEDFSLISPAGAPTLAIYDTIASKAGAETTSQATQIPGFLQSGKYNYVVFDSISALNLTNNAKKANYTYQMMLTGGNFHIAGFNTNNEPQVGDKIVAFGQNLVPDLAFRTCYPNLFTTNNVNNISYVNSVSDVVPILKSGTYQGESIDYCFIAQPALFSVMNSNNNDNIETNNVHDIVNLNDKISEITNGKFNYIPQAALFVKDEYLANKPDYVNSFMEDIKNQMNNARGSNLNDVKTKMELVSTDLVEQQSKYGFNENVALALQKENKNQFGIMDANSPVTIDNINEFLTSINYGKLINKK